MNLTEGKVVDGILVCKLTLSTSIPTASDLEAVGKLDKKLYLLLATGDRSFAGGK